MINQGYSYKVINKINLTNENLYYSKRDEQIELLQKVLTANEAAADEEDATPGGLKSSNSSNVFRTQGTLSTLSGADEGLYMEIQRKQGGKDKQRERHPLFKKFYSSKK